FNQDATRCCCSSVKSNRRCSAGKLLTFQVTSPLFAVPCQASLGGVPAAAMRHSIHARYFPGSTSENGDARFVCASIQILVPFASRNSSVCGLSSASFHFVQSSASIFVLAASLCISPGSQIRSRPLGSTTCSSEYCHRTACGTSTARLATNLTVSR